MTVVQESLANGSLYFCDARSLRSLRLPGVSAVLYLAAWILEPMHASKAHRASLWRCKKYHGLHNAPSVMDTWSSSCPSCPAHRF